MVFLLPKPSSYRMALRELNSPSRAPLWPSPALHPSSPLSPAACAPLKPTRHVRLLSVHASRKEQPKRIGVVGGGTAGLGALIGLLDVPEKARKGWEIELLEKREDVGGLWFKDGDDGVRPPVIPDSPAYPLLHTNTPSPTMTFPNLPQAAGSALFPKYDEIHRYHRRAADHFHLRPHIKFNTEVNNAEYNKHTNTWSVDVTESGQPAKKEYDHLVVANGHLIHPTLPNFEGQEEWLAGGKEEGDREILHALWYRNPERYKGRTVVVIGFGASGWDISTQTVFHADKVYHSYTEKPNASIKYAPVPGTTPINSRISHLDRNGIHFHDRSSLNPDKVSILVGTGYDLLIPFLPMLKVGKLDPDNAHHQLTTNKRYLRPLLHDTFAVQDGMPVDALAFSGLHSFLSNAQASYAQGLLIGHVLANEGGGDAFFAEGREEMYEGLVAKEKRLREAGADQFTAGHKYTAPGTAEDFQDGLVDLVRARSSIAMPDWLADGQPYVSAWRRKYGVRKTAFFLRKGWRRAVEYGVEGQFTEVPGTGGRKVETEAEFVEAMDRLFEWETEQDKVQHREITYQTPPKDKQ